MGKEDNILRKVGTQNPFRVPENYFEDFRLELMNKLPTELRQLHDTFSNAIWNNDLPAYFRPTAVQRTCFGYR